jgi:hypothetical protein
MRIGLARTFVAGALLAGAAPGVAVAQRYVRSPGSAFGINVMVARPVGEFQRFVDWGGGVGLYGLVNVDRNRHVGVRFDGSLVIYGHERFTTPLSATVRRVLVDVNTDNFIVSFGVGPQITMGSGPVRPYLYGTAGFAYFATVSSVSGTADGGAFANTTNFDDVTMALTAGGGLLLRVSRGRHPVSLDLSAQSTYHGETEYLRRGGIIEHSDGSLILLPIRSEANLMNFRLGVAIGL